MENSIHGEVGGREIFHISHSFDIGCQFI